jgi:type VI secretion system secreted protein VgrG
MADLFSLTSDVIPGSAKVLGFRGVEAISTPYRFDVAFAVLPSVDVDMAAALGARATLSIQHDATSPPYVVNGLLAAVELVYEYADRSVFLATLAPRLERLRLTRHSRVFTDLSVPEVLSAVLSSSGLSPRGDFRLELSRPYPRRDHVSQYKESNLAFLSRLMEREGIYYFFRQEGDDDVLVITDHGGSHAPSRQKPARYVALNPGDTTGQEAFATFRHRLAQVPGRTVERDYDYLRPKLDVRGAAAVLRDGGAEEAVVWGETAKSVDGAQVHAAVEAEALRARREVFSGWGRVFDLRAGFTFELDDHPRAGLNRDYLATTIEHQGNDSGGAKDIEELLDLSKMELYLATVEAIPARLQYRSPRRTPWPRIEGIVEGIVDGPAESPYAQIDEHGRYRVHIFFDESGLPDGKASMWVRMIQPHGGNPEGFHFPLRKGTEVAIVFLGGDPDRPAIVGAVPNPLNPSVVTSANASQNVIMTGGTNRLEMEDQAGSQYVTLSSPTLKSFVHLGSGNYNFIASTQGNGFNYFGQNLDVEVLADKSEEVTGSVRETYHDTSYTTVHGATDKQYLDTYDMGVTGNATYVFKSRRDTTVTADSSFQALADHYATVTGAVTQRYGSLTEEVQGLVSLTHRSGRAAEITTSDTVHVTGIQTLAATGHQTFEGGSQHIKSNGDQLIEVTGAQTSNVGSHQTNTRGPWVVYSGPMFEGWSDGDFKLTAAGGNGLVSAHATLNLQASGEIVATAVTITVAAGATVNISGAGTVNVQGGEVNVQGGLVKLN